MADPYEELELLTDTVSLIQIGKDYMSGAIEGWVPNPANIETVLLEAGGEMIAELVGQAVAVPDESFIRLGQSIFDVQRLEGTPARAPAVIVFDADTPPVRIPQDSQVALTHPSGASFLFYTDQDVDAPEGGGSVSLELIAMETGEEPNGAFGLGEFVEVFDGVASITAGTASNGTATETPDEYLQRWARQMTIMNPTPVKPEQFATRALLLPGVGRAVALDLYQPSNTEGGYGLPRDASGHTDVERAVTVVITGPDGAEPGESLMEQVWMDLDGSREVNFLPYVIPPVYTAVDVNAEVVPHAGYSADDAIDAATASLTEWLSTTYWGLSPGRDNAWSVDSEVRLWEAVAAVNKNDPVHYATSVEMRTGVDAFAAADITLPGTVPIAVAGTITVTVP